MQAFEYASPATLKEAVALLGSNWSDAAVLAGGTDLISLMKDYVMSPKRVVSLKNVKELNGVSAAKPNGLRIGAMATLDDLVNNAQVRTQFPSLHQAAMGVASPQIRNMGTVGGDLCQRPRCWYFRQGHGILAMHEGKSLVENGENKYHAIFSSGPAKFVSASSLGPALIALGATIKVQGPNGARDIEAAKFFVEPKSATEREIALQPNEIVVEVRVPATQAKNATYEVRHKEALDWPLVTASVSIGAESRIVLGHVGPAPVWAEQASKMLTSGGGPKATDETIDKVAEAAVAGAKPLSQNAYKVHLAKVATARAIRTALGRA
jgi:xanthine dehydrogenase YagS FAD-binding subunit